MGVPPHPLPAGGAWETVLNGCRVHYAAGGLAGLGELARRVAPEARRVLVVSDPGVEAAGHLAVAVDALASTGLDVATFTDVEASPTSATTARAAGAVVGHGAGLLVGLGGGSAMDTAKGANLLAAGGGTIADYLGWGRARGTLLPSLGVPTTAGTGSEAQAFAVIADAVSGRKLACGDERLRFRGVLLDPRLVASAPPRVRAVAAIDAIAHAVESHAATAANPLSRAFSREAWGRLAATFAAQTSPKPSVADLGEALVGSFLAGAAIDLAMLGAAHAAANPLTTHCRLTHGVAVGLMLPHVVRWNAEAPVAAAAYAELEAGGAEALAARLDSFLELADLPRRLRDADVDRALLPELAAEAAGGWTAAFNPRPVAPADVLAILEAAW